MPNRRQRNDVHKPQKGKQHPASLRPIIHCKSTIKAKVRALPNAGDDRNEEKRPNKNVKKRRVRFARWAKANRPASVISDVPTTIISSYEGPLFIRDIPPQSPQHFTSPQQLRGAHVPVYSLQDASAQMFWANKTQKRAKSTIDKTVADKDELRSCNCVIS